MEQTSDQYIEELNETIERLSQIANRTRKWIVKMTHAAGSGHPGGSLSSTDIMTVLYFHFMRYKAEEPDWEDRDRFVLSKGHAAPAYYATLAQAGFLEEEELMTLRKLGSRLQGHPSMRTLPGIDMSTGSLGQGLSAAIGMALAGRIDRKDYKVYCILGDGEVQEGQIWEASMAAAHYKLENLTVFLDRNNLQIDGPTEKVMGIESIAAKAEAFGYHVIEINGHDYKAIINAVNESHKTHGKPTMIIAHTVKGKGVSFMEGNLDFHGKAPNNDQLAQALEELGGDV